MDQNGFVKNQWNNVITIGDWRGVSTKKKQPCEVEHGLQCDVRFVIAIDTYVPTALQNLQIEKKLRNNRGKTKHIFDKNPQIMHQRQLKYDKKTCEDSFTAAYSNDQFQRQIQQLSNEIHFEEDQPFQTPFLNSIKPAKAQVICIEQLQQNAVADCKQTARNIQTQYKSREVSSFGQVESIVEQEKASLVAQEKASQVAQEKRRKQKRKCRRLIDGQLLRKSKQYFQIYNAAENEGNFSKQITLSQFAQQHGYGCTTIYKLYKQWLIDPTLLKHELMAKHNRTVYRERGMNSRTTERTSFVRQLIQGNPFLEKSQIEQLMKANDKCYRAQSGKNIHWQALHRVLNACKLKRVRLNLISTKRNQPVDKQMRRIYAQHFMAALRDGATHLFIDQMAVNKYTTRDRVWAKQGQVFANAMVEFKKDSFLLVAVMTQQGTLHHQIIHGNAENDKYSALIQRLLHKDRSRSDKKMLILHMAVGQQAKASFSRVGSKLGYKMLMIPPFSSPLNPLEYVFMRIRNQLRGRPSYSDFELLQAVKKIMKEQADRICVPDISAFLTPTLQKCLLGQNI